MCGRFVLTKAPADVAEFFNLGNMPELKPRYNIAPTQSIFAVRQAGGSREGVLLRWGLTPPWSNGMKPLFNARADGVATKPSFRSAFKRRRCLVPADGFYEWLTVGRKKTPHLFSLVDGGLFAMAGLWEGGGDFADSACLITTEANDLVGAVHDRMPVILPREAWDAWIDPDASPSGLQSLLRPYPAVAMTARPVSDFVSSARNEGPACWGAPTSADTPAQATLF
jgi:putative SOS response-associated peptidase YedK